MVQRLAGALAVLLALQGGPAQAQPASPPGSAPTPETACAWGLCPSDKEMIVSGIVVTSAAVATALTASPYGAQQAGEVAAGFLLSGVVSTAASFAVVGALVYYYGPGLWQRVADHAKPEEPAWRQYLDGWQQEIGSWPGEVEALVADYRQIISEKR